jgi:Na+-driven multidrug efflux pump
VLALGALYLRNVAPFYGAIGLALVLYFASQGAGRMLLPVLAGTVRMVIAAFIGWWAVVLLGASLATLFQIIALAAVTYGVLTAAAMLTGAWGRRPASQPLAETGQAE